jgi:hypothetical protein
MVSAARDPNRRSDGTFAPGNQASKGVTKGKGSHAQRAKQRKNRHVAEMESVVTPEDIREITRAHLKKAKQGDRWSTRILLDYLIGRPVQRTVQVTDDDSPLRQLLRDLGEGEDDGGDDA